MPNYSVDGSSGANTDATTILYAVNGATSPRRLYLYHAIIGSPVAPVDQAAEYVIRRLTNENGTPGGTAVTPFPLDEDAPVALSNGVDAPTGEPTFATGSGLAIPLHQRATFQFMANPGDEIVASALDDHGFAIWVESVTSAFNVSSNLIYRE